MNHPSSLFSTRRVAGGSERWRVRDRIAIPRACSYTPVSPTLAPDPIIIVVSLSFHRSAIVHVQLALAPAPSVGALTTLVRRGAVQPAGHLSVRHRDLRRSATYSIMLTSLIQPLPSLTQGSRIATTIHSPLVLLSDVAIPKARQDDCAVLSSPRSQYIAPWILGHARCDPGHAHSGRCP